ncbi:MAG: hypothetical protein HY514_00805 [Candidatus Aenigmarchaeota archaeon]|nr:hypothetical protein [Candidatus Aenigmarchaeota archaeon]
MLSDRGIRQAIKEGTLSIEPFNPYPRDQKTPNLGTCSYNLHNQAFFRVKRRDKTWHDSITIAEVHREITETGIDKFISKKCAKYDGAFVPEQVYVSVSEERVRSELQIEVTTRSSAARKGIEVMPINLRRCEGAGDLVYSLIRTFHTTCETPESRSLCQLLINSEGEVLKFEEIENLLVQKKLRIKTDRYSSLEIPYHPIMSHIEPFGDRGVVLYLGRELKVYNGKPFHIDNDDLACFKIVELNEPFSCLANQFYLGHTDEEIKMPRNYAGMLRKVYGKFFPHDIHPRAPLIANGSEGHQVFEFLFPSPVALWYQMPISGLEILPLRPEPLRTYKGKYLGQQGAQTSLFHQEH